jgi:hypothetical protein
MSQWQMNDPAPNPATAAQNYATAASLLAQWQANAKPSSAAYTSELLTASLIAMLGAIASELGVAGSPVVQQSAGTAQTQAGNSG